MMASDDVTTIKREYRELYKKYRNLRKHKQYKKAHITIDETIALLKANRKLFYEGDDWIQILRACKLMMKYEEERLRQGGAERLIYFLREAANSSTPSVCVGFCQGFEFEKCFPQHNILSRRQSEMCFNKLKYLSNALKIEAAIAARGFHFDQALEKRRAAVAIHEPVIRLNPRENKRQHQQYLRYWCFVTEGYVLLNNGEFVHSKQAFEQALKEAQSFKKEEQCFPNYFRDIKEIQTHPIYVDAIEKIKLAQFGEARGLFQNWLNFHPERMGKMDLRYDNIQIFNHISGILERIPQGQVQRSDWQELERLVDECYVSRTTWALLRRLHWLRELSFHLCQYRKNWLRRRIVQWRLKHEVGRIAKDWQLFLTDTVLLREDRIAGLARKVNLPSFIDMFDHLDENITKWREVLAQNLKNLLLLMADYEHKRYCHDQGQHNKAPNERMNIQEIVQFIYFCLEARSPQKARIFQNALEGLNNVILKIESGSLTDAIRAQKRFFETIRFWPHIILIEKQTQLPKSIFFDEDNPIFLAWEIICSRLWNENPSRVTFECPEKRQEGAFYYLRPRYNVKIGESYRIRHELFLRSDVPKWLCVFYENMFGRAKVNQKQFQDWILQFANSERLKACKLFDMLRVYNEEYVRSAWLDVYRNMLPPEAKTKTVKYFGMGHTAQSGHHALYYFRQAISGVSVSERSFEDKDAFKEISELDEKDIERLNTVVFLDDFIGTGKQAIDLFVNDDGAYLKRYRWLNNVSVYYCALVGFKDGIDNIKTTLNGKLQSFFTSQKMYEKDKAFSEENPIWESHEMREEVKRWAEDIGRQVLTGTQYNPERDKLGYRGCQALVTFHYNIPNNTLPIFWGQGKRHGESWIPLQKRYEKYKPFVS